MASGFLRRLGAALATTTALALSLGSCGGKSGETYTSTGGTKSAGGSSSSGGSKSTGGTSSSGGSGGMVCNGCPAIGCGPGTYSVLLPGDCCPTCVSSCDGIQCPQIRCQFGSYIPEGECCATCNPNQDCTNVLCADPSPCPEGSHVETPAGQCCPQCVTDLTCAEGQAGLQALLDTRMAEYDALSCTVNEDCTVASLGSLCKLDCGTAVNTASAELLTLEIAAYGSVNCVSCPQSGAACPPVVHFSECVESQCVLRP